MLLARVPLFQERRWGGGGGVELVTNRLGCEVDGPRARMAAEEGSVGRMAAI